MNHHKTKNQKTISIITVNWNTLNDTSEFINSFKKVIVPSGYKIETIVVDNGSTDDSVNILNKNFPHIKLVKSPVNLGFAGGNNLGIKYAINHSADYLFIVNNDTIIKDRKIIVRLIETFHTNLEIGFITPKIYFAKGYEFHKKYNKNELGKVIWYAGGKIDWKNILFSHIGVDQIDSPKFSKLQETDFCTGCAIFTSKDVLKKVGLFNEKYFAYLEDVDLCMRVKKAGYKLIYNGSTSIYHKTSQSSGGSGSVLHDYFITRNRLLFGMTHTTLRTKIALTKEAVKLLIWGRPFQKLGVYDFFTRNMSAGQFFKYYKKAHTSIYEAY